MEFQDNSLLDKNHTGEMEMVQVLKNLMLMVTLLPTQLLRKLIIKTLDNHVLHLQIKTMLSQVFLKIVTLYHKTILSKLIPPLFGLTTGKLRISIPKLPKNFTRRHQNLP